MRHEIVAQHLINTNAPSDVIAAFFTIHTRLMLANKTLRDVEFMLGKPELLKQHVASTLATTDPVED